MAAEDGEQSPSGEAVQQQRRQDTRVARTAPLHAIECVQIGRCCKIGSIAKPADAHALLTAPKLRMQM